MVVEGADALGADGTTTIPEIYVGIGVEQQQKSPNARKCGKKESTSVRTLRTLYVPSTNLHTRECTYV